MYLTAETITLDDDEGRVTLEILDDEGRRHAFLIHHVDLDAFYDQVRGRLGPYLRERDEARTRVYRCNPNETGDYKPRPGTLSDLERCVPDPNGGYDLDDPKNESFHSVHADHYDNREKV